MSFRVVAPSELPRVSCANDALDLQVARALEAMRAAPARRWTVADLARIAGLSRAAFARRFARETGTPPLHWLAEHRLRAAERLLLETELPLVAIAIEVGYRCEFAFAKAFKRRTGVAPGTYRRTSFAPPAFRAAA